MQNITPELTLQDEEQEQPAQEIEEKLQKYLANSGFTAEGILKTFLAQNTVTKSNKKLKAESLVYDNDCLTISGEDHIVDLNPGVGNFDISQRCGRFHSNATTDNKETVFSKIPP